MKRVAFAMPVVLLAACATGGTQLTPPAQPVPQATIIEMPVEVYVPIEPKLLAKCKWARDVLPSQSMSAARERGGCAEKYENQLDAIGKVQGKPVPKTGADDP